MGLVLRTLQQRLLGGDRHWPSVVSQLRGEGANNGTVFTDDRGRTWTRGGSAVTSTAQFKYGASSISTAGATGYLTAASHADFAFGTGDFTIEGWFRSTASGTQNWFTFGANWNLFSSGTSLSLWTGSAAISGSGTVVANTWCHVGWVRRGGFTRLYLNGTAVIDTGALSASVAAAAFYLGTYSSLASHLNGFFDDVRITKGVARYTESFTPPGQLLVG